MKWRRLIVITSGDVPLDVWLEAAQQEPPVKGKPRGCAACPLRVGGELEAGAAAAVASASPAQRLLLCRRWGCHEADRPCAGMTRLAASKDMS